MQVRGKGVLSFLLSYLLTFLPSAATFLLSAATFLPSYFLTVLLLATSCAHEEDDLFPESAAQRINHSVSYYQNLLKGSDNGWVIEFVPDGGSYGGRVYTAKFNDDGVTMTSDVSVYMTDGSQSWLAGTELESKYSVKAEQGIILSFDTFNPQLHIWSMPLSSSAPDGYQSDYEFILEKTSAEQDTVYMRGKKYGNEMKMYKLQGMDGKTYMSRVLALERGLIYADLTTVNINGKDYSIDFSNYLCTIVDSTQENPNVRQPMFCTPDGFTLYEPIEVNDAKLEKFTINEANYTINSSDGSATIKIPSLQEQLMSPKGTKYIPEDIYAVQAIWNGWLFSRENMCSSLKDKYDRFSLNDMFYIEYYYTFSNCFLGPAYAKYDRENRGFKQVLSYSWALLPGIFDIYENGCYGVEYEYDEQTGLMSINGRGEGFGYFNTGSQPGWSRRYFTPFCEFIFEHSPYKATFNDGAIKTDIHLVSVGNSDVWFDLQLGSHTLTSNLNYDE